MGDGGVRVVCVVRCMWYRTVCGWSLGVGFDLVWSNRVWFGLRMQIARFRPGMELEVDNNSTPCHQLVVSIIGCCAACAGLATGREVLTVLYGMYCT